MTSELAKTAWAFQFNTGLFKRMTDGIAPERWLERPSDHSNPLLWVAGHLVWERSGILKMLGQSWTRPGCDQWCGQFARGLPYVQSAPHPAPAELLAAFDEVSAELVAAVRNASPELVEKPSPEGLPSADGTLSGGLTFYTIHEGYHLGQLGYLRKWLGYSPALG